MEAMVFGSIICLLGFGERPVSDDPDQLR